MWAVPGVYVKLHAVKIRVFWAQHDRKDHSPDHGYSCYAQRIRLPSRKGLLELQIQKGAADSSGSSRQKVSNPSHLNRSGCVGRSPASLAARAPQLIQSRRKSTVLRKNCCKYLVRKSTNIVAISLGSFGSFQVSATSRKTSHHCRAR